MPSLGAIVWAAIAGVIILMLGVIGYLIKTGIDGIKEQLAKIWEKVDAHHAASEANRVAIAEINIRCEERHGQRSGIDRRKPHP